MSLRHNTFLATCLLAGLSTFSASAARAAPDNAAVANRALAQISRFPAMSLHGPDQSYDVRDVMVDADGTEHVRFDRRYKGLRVIGGDLVVHSSVMGVLRGVSKTLEQSIRVDLRPTVAADMALATALSGRPGFVSAGKPEQVVYARAGLPELAYDVRVDGVRADGTPSELHVIVSGVNGRVLDSWDDVHTADVAGTGKSYYLGAVGLTTDQTAATTYYLRDMTRGKHYTADMKGKTSVAYYFTDTDNLWGDGTLANSQTVAVDAQFGYATTFDYFKNVHGRNGIDPLSTKAPYSRVHYSRAYDNAFWSDSCFCMTYGDGGTYFYPLTSLDVAGHEMSHGVTSRTAKLTYSGESGGLNEATSDIFGTAVEFYANNTKDTGDYLIGEKVVKPAYFPAGALRSMIQPSADGVSADCWYSGLGSLDVHYSSGVANHFFFLLAEGTTSGVPSKTCAVGNTRVASGTGTLTGITRAKAEKIWYRALTTYMTSSTNYAGARTATLKAATDLYGASSPEYLAVAAAWSALLVN